MIEKSIEETSNVGRKSNFYDSKYLAEYYDLWTHANLEAVELGSEAEIYLSALKEGLQSHETGFFLALDVGTGTGRVLINLANDSVKCGLDVSNTELIGVDKEQAMIDRATDVQRNTSSFSKFAHVSWSTGEATNLSLLPLLSSRQGQVDLLIFAVGSISHLKEANEPQEFFEQVAKLLRPGSGRAYIPIQSDLICQNSVSEFKLNKDTWAEVRVAQTFESQLYGGVVYKQYPIHSATVDGYLKHDKYHFEVVRKDENGKEEVIENNEIEISLRIWEKPQLLEWAGQAGLGCVKTFQSSHEDYFIFEKV